MKENKCKVCGREGGHIKPIDKSVKQYQEDIKAGVDVSEPMGVSEWMRIGKANGYHDYWKDMTRIAIMKELLEEVEKLKQPHKGHVNYHLTNGFNQALDTVISIIKK